MKFILIIPLLAISILGQAQSKVMRELAEEYPDAFVLMFYHSSLAMLNIDDDPDFARMISNLDRIKVMRIDKAKEKFTETSNLELKDNLDKRGYEKMMTIKSKDFDVGVYIIEDDGEIEGFFLLMDEDEEFMAIDIVGSMAIGDISKLVEKIKNIKEFKDF